MQRTNETLPFPPPVVPVPLSRATLTFPNAIRPDARPVSNGTSRTAAA